MKKIQVILAIALFFITLSSYSCSNKNSNNKSANGTVLKEISNGEFLPSIPDKFIGVWKGDCDMSAGKIEINKDNSISMEINSGQIYIVAKAKISDQSSDILELYLDNPGECGPGGAGMAWDDFSRIKPICTLDFSTTDSPKMDWLGFFNEKTKKVEWKDGPDWVSEDFNGIFKKCLSITPPEDYEDVFNQYSFNQENEELIFYYNIDNKKGKIVVDDKEYVLDKLISTDDGVYSISGEGIKISSSKIIPFEYEGGDCTGGTFENLTITIISDGSSIAFNNVMMAICF